jgi:NAD(P)-dependent dehydrogenase (short-subunit alcohol dehydrogenase family)
MGLEGRVALITGAGSGIGRARRFGDGCRYRGGICGDGDRDSPEAGRYRAGSAVRHRNRGLYRGGRRCDARRFWPARCPLQQCRPYDVESHLQDIDILTISTETWDKMMDVTLRGTMLGCRYGVRAMIRSGGGSIINTSSTFGLAAHNLNVAYRVAKAGINMLTAYVATAFGRKGIRCNAVAPSLIMTPAAKRFLPEDRRKIHEDSTLTATLGEPEDLAEVVAFLASDRSRYLTGQVIRVHGGTLAHLPTYSDWRCEVG